MIGDHKDRGTLGMGQSFVVNVELVNFGLKRNLGGFGVNTQISHLRSWNSGAMAKHSKLPKLF